jgi:hypothetical protein
MRKLISSEVEDCPFSKSKYIRKEYLVNEEEFVTLNNIKFKLRTYDLVLEDEKGNEKIFYRKTEVDHNNKVVIGNDGIPGSGTLKQSISKAKKWLEKNNEKVLKGGGYRIKST